MGIELTTENITKYHLSILLSMFSGIDIHILKEENKSRLRFLF